MSNVRSLRPLLQPTSVAVVGASDKPRSVGALLMRNLQESGFPGRIAPVNPNYAEVAGMVSVPNARNLDFVPDLAVICTPPTTVGAILDDLGAVGCGAVVVVSSGYPLDRVGADGQALREVCRRAALEYGFRLLGPNCLGLIVPQARLNASFAHIQAPGGRLALLSQSGAICTAILDYAASVGIGFSHFVSLGDCVDVGAADLLDYLSQDPETDAILLYLESVGEARAFMSAARAASREKPVIIIKAGRYAVSAKAAQVHTGAFEGSDLVCDAAIRRAGMLRVHGIDELFAAVETLARSKLAGGGALAVLTNGGGPGVIALDALLASGGESVRLSDGTLGELRAILPPTCGVGSLVDIAGDADAARYAEALGLLLHDRAVNDVLVLYVPAATAPAEEVAQAVADVAASSGKNILTSFMGRNAVREAKLLLARRGLPVYDTPGMAVRAFRHIQMYRRNQTMLMQTPPSIPDGLPPDLAEAARIMRQAREAGRLILNQAESSAMLRAYGLYALEVCMAATPEEAATQAAGIGFPVALEIADPECREPDLTRLDHSRLHTEAEVFGAAVELSAQAPASPSPSLRFVVRRQARLSYVRELAVGIARDAVFGPVLYLAPAGPVPLTRPGARVALPPLNLLLARDLIDHSGLRDALGPTCGQPAADVAALELLLVDLSQLILDFPDIAGVELNPLLLSPSGAFVQQARIELAQSGPQAEVQPVIRPYPRELEETAIDRKGCVCLIRPIRPEDEAGLERLLRACTPEDIRYRFFSLVREFSHNRLARFTQIDYGRDMTFVAESPEGHLLGMAGASRDSRRDSAEFSVIVRSDLQGHGLGHLLMIRLISYLRSSGIRTVTGQVLRENGGMIRLAAKLGFVKRFNYTEGCLEITLHL